MRMRLLATLVLLSASILYTKPTYADDLTGEPGYVEFADLDGIYGEPKVMVNLNEVMLGFVSKLNASDPETNEIIRKLKGVRVNVYDLDGNEQPALDLLRSVSDDLQPRGWFPIVSVNEDDERVRIFTKVTNDIMDGLVVMVVDQSGSGEAVFINVVGEIDPEDINRVTDSLNIDVDLR